MPAAPDSHRFRRAATILLVPLFLIVALGHQAARPSENAKRTMQGLINEDREAQGRAGVRLIAKLNQIAHHHSEEMAASGSIYHNPDLEKEAADLHPRYLGENVGVGESILAVHEAFMEDSAHRRVILRRVYEAIGVGVVQSGGRTWVTVVFAGW